MMAQVDSAIQTAGTALAILLVALVVIAVFLQSKRSATQHHQSYTVAQLRESAQRLTDVAKEALEPHKQELVAFLLLLTRSDYSRSPGERQLIDCIATMAPPDEQAALCNPEQWLLSQEITPLCLDSYRDITRAHQRVARRNLLMFWNRQAIPSDQAITILLAYGSQLEDIKHRLSTA